MKFQFLLTILWSILFISCHTDGDFSIPQSGIVDTAPDTEIDCHHQNLHINCLIQSFQTGINDEIYTFGNGWLEFNTAFTVHASFQPTEIRIYANNVALCDYLDLELVVYTYTLETQPTPNYKVILPEVDLVPLVNGVALKGNFDYKQKEYTAISEELAVE